MDKKEGAVLFIRLNNDDCKRIAITQRVNQGYVSDSPDIPRLEFP